VIKAKEHKTALYCMGCIVITLIWLIFFAGAVSVISILKSTLLIILSYIAMIFDINTKRIPNILVLTMICGWFLLVTPILFFHIESGVELMVDSIYGLLMGGGLFLLVYLISRKGLGGGDVKFMAAAGLYLGFAGVIPAILYGTILAALTGLVLIIMKKINRKDAIPLAPFLFVGILITIFSGSS